MLQIAWPKDCTTASLIATYYKLVNKKWREFYNTKLSENSVLKEVQRVESNPLRHRDQEFYLSLWTRIYSKGLFYGWSKAGNIVGWKWIMMLRDRIIAIFKKWSRAETKHLSQKSNSLQNTLENWEWRRKKLQLPCSIPASPSFHRIGRILFSALNILDILNVQLH